uniref:Uncharacterized protein n=1 Tax=Lactuca sativa TaxID=4236 RepID=A0A9R1V5N4_LACSA|nr:hypothetical protein LSAT_V11C600341290 [Lactuca sativa]
MWYFQFGGGRARPDRNATLYDATNWFGVIMSNSGLGTSYHLIAEDQQHKLITEDKKPAIEAAAFKKQRSIKNDKKQEEEVQHCSHCNHDGHNREGCFKRIGYREWWPGKRMKTRKIQEPPTLKVVRFPFVTARKPGLHD